MQMSHICVVSAVSHTALHVGWFISADQLGYMVLELVLVHDLTCFSVNCVPEIWCSKAVCFPSCDCFDVGNFHLLGICTSGVPSSVVVNMLKYFV